jgi:hypothetical protein
MAYSNQTPALGLPQWEGTDPPERTDYNDAFLAIDGAVSGLLTREEYQEMRPVIESEINALAQQAAQIRVYASQF